MNRFKCPACGGNQYTACDTVDECIYCGHKELEKMKIKEDEDWRNLECRSRKRERRSVNTFQENRHGKGGCQR